MPWRRKFELNAPHLGLLGISGEKQHITTSYQESKDSQFAFEQPVSNESFFFKTAPFEVTWAGKSYWGGVWRREQGSLGGNLCEMSINVGGSRWMSCMSANVQGSKSAISVFQPAEPRSSSPAVGGPNLCAAGENF